MNRTLKISYFLFLFTAILVSCHPKKAIEQTDRLKNKSSKELVALLRLSDFKGDWLSTKGNVELLFKGESNSLRSNLRMRVDSATWISLSKATLPVLTSLISADSVKLLNKLDKSYFLSDFTYINDLLNTEIDYTLLQDFFVGNPIAFDYEEEYVVRTEDNSYLISSEKSKKIEKLIKKGKIKDEPILYRCWIESTHFKCEKVIINLLTQKTTLTVDYGSWEDIGGQLFPMKAKIHLTTPNDTLSLEMDYSKVEFNEPLSFPFNIPDSYKPFTLEGNE